MTYTVFVEPVTEEGRGIPFGKRTVYMVRTEYNGQPVPGPKLGFYSLKMANAVAEHQVRVLKAGIADFVADWDSGIRARIRFSDEQYRAQKGPLN